MPTVAYLDSTYVKVHQHAAVARDQRHREGIGMSRGGKTTKLHMLVSMKRGKFVPLAGASSPGHVADVSVAREVIAASTPAPRTVVADKAYDSDRLCADLRERGVRPVVPSRSTSKKPRPTSAKLYGQRHIIERFFGRLKQARRLSTRYERHVSNWRSFCQLAMVGILLLGS